MKTRSLYDPASGLFTGRIVTCSDDQLAANLKPRDRAVEGRFDRVCQRVDFAALDLATPGDYSTPADFVVDHQPPRPDNDHDWIAENPTAPTRAGQRWRWKKRAGVLQRELDEQRARRVLADLDAAARVQDRLTPEERETLRRLYRSAEELSGTIPTEP